MQDVSTEDLSEIPSNETPALALPNITVNKAAVYVWGLDLSSLNEGDYIYMHMFPEASASAASFYASAAESEAYAFLDDDGSKIDRVPAGKKVNVAAYMTPAYTYAPVITVSTSASEEPAESEDVTPVVPDTPTSEDVTPVVPESGDVPSDMPDEPASGDNPPDMPDAPESGDNPPDMPDAPESGDNPPDMPDAPESGDVPSDMPDGPASGDTPSEDTGDDSGSDSGDDSGSTDSETVTGETYTSSTAFENALLIDGATSTYTNITVTKYGDASGQSENYDWYGTNAAILAQGGADVTITGANITTAAVGGNAVFAYGGNSGMNTNNSGDGTKITISDSTITTSSHNSGGIMVTGGGIIEASNLTITTSEGSSAAIRSDRGGGTINVTGGTYTTSGSGSPAIYSTAAITGNDVTLESKTAQVVVIEGGNSVTLTDSTLIANNNKLNSDNDTYYQAVMIYQSQSGDASSGSSFFKMAGGSLTNAQGDIFHVTNTTTTITLSESIAITNNDASGYFLRASTDSWGSSGNNGGNVTLNADGQTIDGNMLVDSVSSLAFNMTNSSIFNGAINPSGTAGSVSVVMDSTSVWNLTGDSYLTSAPEGGTINRGSYNIYVNGEVYSN